jgi:outer membrane receptor protein involved in Fe transport
VHAAAGTFDKGNVDLDAETNTGGELVLRARAAQVTAQLSGYYNKINDYITADVVGDTTIVDETDPTIVEVFPLVRYAQADASLRGVEGQFEVEFAPGWVVGGMGDMVRGELDDDTPLPFMPAARLGALTRYQQGAWAAEANYRHGFAQRRVPPPATPDDPSAVTTAAYNLVDLSLGYTLISGGLVHSITGRVDNIFDEEYRDATSRIKRFASNPGRNFALVYKLLF